MTDVSEFDLLEESEPRRGGFGLGSIVLLIGIIIVAGVVGLALVKQSQTQPTSGPAPAFEMTTFDGQPFSLADMRGKVVVLNFWASWCIPCKEEAPALQAIWEKYRDRGVVVVGVAYVDNESDSLAFMSQYGVTYPNGADLETRISESYNIVGVPETFVIDQNGNVVEFMIAQVTEDHLTQTLDRVLQAT
jgi:cytochrome c biogenesis protein CcmG, thiol:disulfide interchange protein DsbE